MAKCYIVPIDQNVAYLGIKSLLNPYTGGPWRDRGGGAPNLFGGNIDEGVSVDETLYLETRQESHFKIDLVQLDLPNKVQVHQHTLLNGIVMTFYAIRGSFTYNRDPYYPDIIADKPANRETTGQILRVDLTTIPTTCPVALANALVTVAASAGLTVQVTAFRNSASAEALRQCALRVAAGTL